MVENYLERDHEEGYLAINDYELFYRRFGEGDEVLLVVHGGPGAPHDYLLPLARHGSSDVSVYFYDQFGVGRSNTPAPGDFDRYTIDHYREEIEAVRRELDPDCLHIYGQSSGGVVAQEYILEHPDHVDSLMLSSTFADTKSAYDSIRSKLEELPTENRETIHELEAKRAFDSSEYEAALGMVYGQHMCRMETFPDPVLRTFAGLNMDIYGIMWGPSEFVLAEEARLRGWDIRDRLAEIDVPTLVLTGTHDEISPDIAHDLADRIPTADIVEFEESSHMPYWEQPDEHFEAVESFLESRRT